ncbi:MAG: nitroreductase [Bacteroidetes bacterium GWC2_33_15]|nr:MAG: nitroreductase [Bacteroidetes bacterium GWA2_33_15]OFX51092.1 MAG: nitroreductase [Bacteroidetes bacterium GWC2_33_15]OFX66475.1 MAG: nitroreductase [Bacteroidetes bacterium GWB2_32_14]OFX70300.1 MAG: nitroreductase [Bacteroidetes bacterium GWD2_33_33]HAN17299.1 nitroreductase [Bacteroidales bacterium]
MISGTDFLKIIQKRQSDRAYLTSSIEQEKINRIIEAAHLAPSACNSQPWKFIVIDNPEIKNKIADCTSSKILGMNHFTKQAPVHIVIVEEKANFTSSAGSTIKNKQFPLIDIGIAAENICLQATAEGLGTCMIGWFDETKVKKLLQIPKSKRVPLIITIGYPAKETRDKRRKQLDEIVSYNKY